jgi:hypothetical protein
MSSVQFTRLLCIYDNTLTALPVFVEHQIQKQVSHYVSNKKWDPTWDALQQHRL